MSIDPKFAERLDAEDPLRNFREDFHLPGGAAPHIYFSGHSLGLMPRSARAAIDTELDAWARYGVEAHFRGDSPWVSTHEQLSAPLAELTGALPSEVVAMNSLTVNLHLLLASFFRPTGTRHKILIEQGAFPSDRYAVESQLRWHGLDPKHSLLQINPRTGERLLRLEDIDALLEHEGAHIAVVLLPGVQYLTGQCLDTRAIVSKARAKGCIVGLDLAHAIGNVPLSLHDWEVDFAVWCSYKYLNGGPGAIGGAFVHDRHARTNGVRLAGWWGHDKQTRFTMPEAFTALPGAEGWQVSNPSVLALAPLRASLQIFRRATLPALRAKSIQLTDYLLRLMAARLADRVEVVSPSEASERGSQVSLRLKSEVPGSRVREQLAARHVVCDWREPDILRVAPVPLYNTYQEVWKFVDILRETLG